ncbi:hypothetical protein FCH28_01470 [Streptomyces piniterrae]|uniref:Uncharacterized protein n=1 Tax=Streptomyces piniterrae TaxID=2571125 RepID=A0A4U0NVS2_9ACTN|nr:DUF6400 family protein [Streptomyces piniterrae]TJZ58856.1 hypothetical protein FCH28_01470 [Streptomyces piniterrae]
MIDRNTSDHQIFEFDLTEHETRRRTEVLAALGDTWDPVAVLEAETEANRLLYSGLDAEQQATYEMLVAAGVLPASGRE